MNAIRHLGAWSPHFEALAKLSADPDTEVRAAAIKALGEASVKHPAALGVMMRFAGPSLEGPVAPDRRGKPIKVGAAYERDFERFLVRMFLERHPEVVAKFLDSEAAAKLPVEARVLAALDTIAAEHPAGHVLALAYAALLPGDQSVRFPMLMAKARSLPEAREAVRHGDISAGDEHGRTWRELFPKQYGD
mgnify:CR=1 FL=1